MIRNFIYSFHRVLGAVLSLLFLMWFVTGLVLIYHPFPSVTDEDRYQHMEVIESELLPIDSMLKNIPVEEKIKSLTLNQRQEQPVFTIKTDKKEYLISANGFIIEPKDLTFDAVRSIAVKWCQAPIIKVDTLHDLEQWIMYSKYEKELPIYKFYFDDKEKTQLYISSRTAVVQQKTTVHERFWSWVGFIPHKFYIVPLRKHTQIWINTIWICGVLGLLMCFGGIYVGIDAYIRRFKRKGKFESPYRKPWYWWHHVLGIIFGIFLITWTFSGMMSLKKVPQWVVKTHQEYKVSKLIKGKRPSIDKYVLDYRVLQQVYPDLKQVEWSYFQEVPVLKVVDGSKEIALDASSAEIKELFLSEEAIEKAIHKIHGDDALFKISLISDYDNYYLPWRKKMALPVYKVEVSDPDHSTYYINPKSGDYKYLNNNKKARKWIFNALHYFHIKELMKHPLVWTIVIWVLTLGGIVVSGTGVWLSIGFFRRKLKLRKIK